VTATLSVTVEGIIIAAGILLLLLLLIALIAGKYGSF
jgi:hypothetical protein